MIKHLQLKKVLATLLTIVAVFAGQQAFATVTELMSFTGQSGNIGGITYYVWSINGFMGAYSQPRTQGNSCTFNGQHINLDGGSVTITGTINFASSNSLTNVITGSQVTIVFSSDNFWFYGATVKKLDGTSVSGCSVTPSSDHTYITVTIPSGRTFGNIFLDFVAFEPFNTTNTTISGINATYIYQGSAVEPVPTVTYKNRVLTAGTDYTVSYANNNGAGTATLTVTGTGEYAGTVTRNFNIRNVALSDFTSLGNNTYEIANKDDLDHLAALVDFAANDCQGLTFKQTADIAYTHGSSSTENNFTQIGGYFVINGTGSDKNFCGTYDGQNHTIYGIRVYKTPTTNANANKNVALFGRISGATIQNVILTDARLTGYKYVGGLVGNNVGGTVQNCLIIGANITCGDTNVGALIGSNNTSSTLTANYYRNCVVYLSGTANTTNVGVGNGSSSHDVDGARSMHPLTLGQNITASGESVTYQSTTYYASNTAITLSHNNSTGYQVTYSLNGTALSGNTFTMPANDNASVTATLTPITYNITYNLDGGSVSTANPTSYNVTTPTFTLNNPTKEGYTFTGWTGTDLTQPTATVTIIQGSIGDRSYTANWTPTNYNITYNLDGGSVTPANPTTYNITTPTFTLVNPTRTGYTFVGWTGTDLTQLTQTVTITQGSIGDRSYTANWIRNYTITYNLFGGTVTPANPTTYNVETPTFTLNNPTKAEYTFVGWTGSNGDTPQTTVTITQGTTGNLNYTAHWSLSLNWPGSGTENDPFLITTTNQLDQLAKMVNGTDGYTPEPFSGLYFKLANDLAYDPTNLTIDNDGDGVNESNYTPIGGYYPHGVANNDQSFSGIFDGDGHTISGIRSYKNPNVDITVHQNKYQALFGRISGAIVKNITLVDAQFTGVRLVGGIVGQCVNSAVMNCLVFESTVISGNSYGGAVIGNNNTSGFTENYYHNCSVTVNGNTATSNVGIGGTGDPSDTYNVRGIFTLTLGTDITATGTATLNYNGTDYYAAGTEIALTYSGTIPQGQYLTFKVNNMPIENNGNTFAMPAANANVQVEFSGWTGSGTESDPYIISTTTELDLLAQCVNNGDNFNGKFFKLVNSINYNGTENNYTPIGTDLHPFNGTFNGDNKTISGINVNLSEDNVGLFGYVNGGTVQNVVLSNCTFIGNSFIGGIVGNTLGDIENCFVNNANISGNFGGAVFGYGYNSFEQPITISHNYYHNCAVNGVTDYVGCSIYEISSGGYVGGTVNYFGDIPENDGAVQVFSLSIGENVTATPAPVVTYDSTNYYIAGTEITLTYSDLVPAGAILTYRLNGNAITGDSFTMPAEDASVDAMVFMTWALLKEALEAGQSVTLINDVTRDADESINIQLYVEDGITLDLNGHRIDGNAPDNTGSIFYINRQDGGYAPQLIITDSSDGQNGSIGNSNTSAIYVGDYGHLTLIAGTIDNSLQGVYNDGYMEMYGGSITGCTHGIYNLSYYYGIYMYGGSITGCSDYGVYNMDYSQMYMYGGSITGNGKGVDGNLYRFEVSGDVNITGNTAYDINIDNIYEIDNIHHIMFNGALAETARIGLYSSDFEGYYYWADNLIYDYYSFTPNLDNCSRANFLSDKADLAIMTDGNAYVLATAFTLTVPEGFSVLGLDDDDTYYGSALTPEANGTYKVGWGDHVALNAPAGYTITSATLTYDGTDHEITPQEGYYIFEMPTADATVSATTSTEVMWGIADGADGSAEHPYLISTIPELDLLARNVHLGNNYSNTYFRQVANLDFNGSYSMPIGDDHTSFKGHYDGSDYTISRFTNDAGLFGRVDGGSVAHVTLDSCIINGENNCGGIVGYLQNGTVSGCNVEDAEIYGSSYLGGIVGYLADDGIVSECSVEDAEIEGNDYLGGIVGRLANNGTVSDCNVEHADINSNYHYSYSGGIVGYQRNGTVSGCNVEDAEIEGNDYLGGIVGFLFDDGTISNCHVEDATINGSYSLGGIVGAIQNGNVSDCNVVNADIDGSSYLGGIVGDLWRSTVSNCSVESTVTVHANSDTDHGGIAGYMENSTITGCISAAQVTGDGYTNCNGGIVGGIYDDYDPGSTIKDCLYTGTTVSGGSYRGALVGRVQNEEYLTLTNNYYTATSVPGAINDDDWNWDGARRGHTVTLLDENIAFAGEVTPYSHSGLTAIGESVLQYDGTHYSGIYQYVHLTYVGYVPEDATVGYYVEEEPIVGDSIDMPDYDITVTATVFHPSYYTLANSIESGKRYILVGWDGVQPYAMSYQAHQNYRTSLAISDNENMLTTTIATDTVNGIHEFTIDFLFSEQQEDIYSIQDVTTIEKGFLYASSSSPNERYLSTNPMLSDNGYWSITFAVNGSAEIVSRGSSPCRIMRYDNNNHAFRCYNSVSSQPVYLYEKVPTFTKDIAGYEDNTSGWNLIASPLASEVEVDKVKHIKDNTYDLYRFNQSVAAEWENWKAIGTDHYHFNLEPGRGYLYANSEDMTLTFIGKPYSGDGEVALTYSTDNPDENMRGWNLIGNPFVTEATIEGWPFYRMNAAGSEIIVATDNIVNPMEGIFVKATQANQTVTFAPAIRGNAISNSAALVMNLTQRSGAVIDRAIVRFDEDRQLPKLQIFENSDKLYIPQGGKDYAVVSVGNVGEMPVNFKAKENGEYTIMVNPEGVDLAYLHLIDNMTGADVDLLAPSLRAVTARHEAGSNPEQPATYTFTAKTTDYESRFKLVFCAMEGANSDNEAFAFIDASGNIVITVDAGDATLQVIDVMGRVIVSVGGHTRCVPTSGFAPGVYVLRLVNGNNVRTQKIVIE